MSELSAFETAEFDELAESAADAEAMSAAGRGPRLQLVAGSRQPAFPAGRSEPNVWPAGDPRHAGPSPVRLTRRGRLVLGAFAVVVATVAITLVSMAVSGAQASNHWRAGAGYQGMHQIVVRPGESVIAARGSTVGASYVWRACRAMPRCWPWRGGMRSR